MTGLVKPKKIDIADSNIALLGSDVRKKINFSWKKPYAKIQPLPRRHGKRRVRKCMINLLIEEELKSGELKSSKLFLGLKTNMENFFQVIVILF